MFTRMILQPERRSSGSLSGADLYNSPVIIREAGEESLNNVQYWDNKQALLIKNGDYVHVKGAVHSKNVPVVLFINLGHRDFFLLSNFMGLCGARSPEKIHQYFPCRSKGRASLISAVRILNNNLKKRVSDVLLMIVTSDLSDNVIITASYTIQFTSLDEMMHCFL